ncbi:hypothetical protein C9374_006511 [Naegleria lovaniensis]|uniref:Uncharacterized protein n=1 Tax=Naegleria lovaniensis TaxID=51637 RepID=A0AA88GNC9_NAELO|nr:uncharacterized protein C9374_012123 [Naegleria lovaniensis]XP_044547202.1 uncharacterized protein C9374_006511 [Naegleria lovaniensis]KAG2373516.1 hypothetical protein C9374_012123 [Naegleria lovaniensis]KAG2381522.1 hypothetical protein C9374_006511 [Naegleria lovaniensis]
MSSEEPTHEESSNSPSTTTTTTSSNLGKRTLEEASPTSTEASSESNKNQATLQNLAQDVQQLINAIPKGWYFTPLDPIRPGQNEYSTYERFPYHELPSAEDVHKKTGQDPEESTFTFDGVFKGDWKWKLDSMKKDIEQYQELRKKELEEKEEQEEGDNSKFGLINVDSEFEEGDLELIPPVIRTLFDSVYHMFLTVDAESPTACYFNLMKPIGPLKKYYPKHEFYLLPFFNDQQSCLTWFALYDNKVKMSELDPTSPPILGSFDHPVVVSGISICDEDLENISFSDIEYQSNGVEEFVWRTVLEGKLWMCLHPSVGKMQIKDIKFLPAKRYAMHLEKLNNEKKNKQQPQSSSTDSK